VCCEPLILKEEGDLMKISIIVEIFHKLENFKTYKTCTCFTAQSGPSLILTRAPPLISNAAVHDSRKVTILNIY